MAIFSREKFPPALSARSFRRIEVHFEGDVFEGDVAPIIPLPDWSGLERQMSIVSLGWNK
jgi:hypothetical protein